ncbi:MAG: HD domain-containing protein [Candidatus Nealsonbacteria bacterium]|nr:HD domain-containing protein [Candidatus Nealsonbacteria bacterium]
MENTLKFLLEVNKLKQTQRTGWVWLGVDNPETIAEHIFRVTVMNWLLAIRSRPELDAKKIIKRSLAHDLCEVYAGDITPYWDLLPEDEEERKEALKRWVRLPRKEKEERAKKKFETEKESLQQLLQYLEPETRGEIFSSWMDYERGITPEGRFAKQGDKVETLIQAIEYFGTGEDTPVIGWWEETEEVVEDKVFVDLLKSIQKKFYEGEEGDGLLEFIVRIGKLKRMPRQGWVLRGVEDPETIGSHIFMLTLMAWIFHSKSAYELDEERLLEMALSHELCEVYAGDRTPYYPVFAGEEQGKAKKKEIFEKWIRLSREEKKKNFLQDFNQEKDSIQKLASCLSGGLEDKVCLSWKEFKKNQTREAGFLNQLYVIETLLQALIYWKEDKSFPIESWWEWAFESSDAKVSMKFMEELKKEFY